MPTRQVGHFGRLAVKAGVATPDVVEIYLFSDEAQLTVFWLGIFPTYSPKESPKNTD